MAARQQRILVLGASGQLGRAVVDEALRHQFVVRAGVRNTNSLSAREGLEVVQVTLESQNSLENALTGVDSVICVIGGPRGPGKFELMKNCLPILVDAMIALHVERLVLTSCIAATKEGYQSLTNGQRLFTFGLRLRGIYGDMRAMEKYIETVEDGKFSRVFATTVRLPNLVNEPASNAKIIAKVGPIVDNVLSSMPRANAAQFLVSCVLENSYEHAKISIGLRPS